MGGGTGSCILRKQLRHKLPIIMSAAKNFSSGIATVSEKKERVALVWHNPLLLYLAFYA